MYVSDDLSIPARTGGSTKNKILRFLKSGTAMTVLEQDQAAGYSRIRLADGFEGWVLSSELMSAPGAKEQLASAKARNSRLTEQRNTLRNEVKALKQEREQQDKLLAQLNTEKTALEQRYEKLRATASRPVELAEENETLKQDQASKAEKISSLTAEVERLGSDVKKQWFLVGGGVAIGSLLLGIILTRIPWRRRKDDWGGF
jgi:SH3 domain protein